MEDGSRKNNWPKPPTKILIRKNLHIHEKKQTPETKSSHLKNGAPWKRRFLLETIILRGELLVLGMVDSLENEGLEPLEWRFGSNDFPDFTWFLRTCAGNPIPHPHHPPSLPTPTASPYPTNASSKILPTATPIQTAVKAPNKKFQGINLSKPEVRSMCSSTWSQVD